MVHLSPGGWMWSCNSEALSLLCKLLFEDNHYWGLTAPAPKLPRHSELHCCLCAERSRVQYWSREPPSALRRHSDFEKHFKSWSRPKNIIPEEELAMRNPSQVLSRDGQQLPIASPWHSCRAAGSQSELHFLTDYGVCYTERYENTAPPPPYGNKTKPGSPAPASLLPKMSLPPGDGFSAVFIAWISDTCYTGHWCGTVGCF